MADDEPIIDADKDKDQADKDVKTEVETPEDSLVISKEEFANMQKSMIELQSKADEAEKAKVKGERDSVFRQLETLNPKLAKIHEKSSKAVLEGALSAATEMKGGFPSLNKENDKPKEASAGDHDTMSYDFVKQDWAYQ